MNINLLTLLQLIKQGVDSRILTEQGLTFSQISALFALAMEESLLEHTDSGFVVSPKGHAALDNREAKELYGAPGVWVIPDKKYQIAKSSADEIYLPKQSDLKFL
jgi:hypothetical protein